MFPQADDVLRIACRGQHIERWTLPRSDFPMNRPGYLQWRQEQGRRHAERIAGIMADAGYPADDIDRARRMLTKQGIKRDPQVQALEVKEGEDMLQACDDALAAGVDPDWVAQARLRLRHRRWPRQRQDRARRSRRRPSSRRPSVLLA